MPKLKYCRQRKGGRFPRGPRKTPARWPHKNVRPGGSPIVDQQVRAIEQVQVWGMPTAWLREPCAAGPPGHECPRYAANEKPAEAGSLVGIPFEPGLPGFLVET